MLSDDGQSFKPGEITPEKANRIGYETAMRWTKGKYAFFVATHTDKAHIHNHIYYNSTSLDCTRKFRDFIGSGRAVRRLSDRICLENDLSVITNPKLHSKGRFLHYGAWLGTERQPPYKEQLRLAINEALAKRPADFDAFLRLMEASGFTKGLSRLGRNYLKTGELIEVIFPEYDVRYIAINDGVDTAREDNEFTPLRNWFNEFYARDTSKKIRAVKQAKAQRGERVNGEVPYGYIIAPENKNHLLPDPETAHVVRQIFAMYIRGDRICEIQDWLRENKVLTVSELRYRRTGSCPHPRPHPS